MPSFESMKAGYRNLWSRAITTRADEAGHVADKIIRNKARYQTVEKFTGVPWFWIGPVHNRESGMNFDRHLHNGDPLSERTRHVPAGRPVLGKPPFTWMESAIDALKLKDLHQIKTWTLERILYEWERYNGWGYIGKGNSPYLWAGTNQYRGGKYIADHVYSRDAWDKQLGCVAILKELERRNAEVRLRLTSPNGIPNPPDIEPVPPRPEHWLVRLIKLILSLFKRR